MRGLQPDEHVDVIARATHAFGNSAQSANCTAKVIVKTCPSLRSDDGVAVFRREGDMVMKAKVG